MVLAGGVAAVAVASIFVAGAQTAALTVSCAGNVSGNQITWTATSTGGISPYSFLWSGDSQVVGSASTSILATYLANGIYTADIQTEDASSTVATSTCSATVTTNTPPTTTSTLNVLVTVNNSAGGTATPSNFTISVNGANAMPSSFSGGNSTPITLNAGATYAVSASTVEDYSITESGNCSGSIATGTSVSCTIAETYVPPTTTPPQPPLPRVNPPSLSIGPNGMFLARGMTVTSVASGSFQGTVWGITYTVNWSGSFYPQFYLRGGNAEVSVTNPDNQLDVGDEVGVSGRVASSSPLTVMANVVRDYSITVLRPGKREGQPTSPYYNGQGNGGQGGNGNENGNGNVSVGVSSSVDFGALLSNLMDQLKNLESRVHGNSGQ